MEGIGALIQTLEKAMEGKRLAISKWFIKTGKVTEPGNRRRRLTCAPDNRTVHIRIPYFGKVTRTADAGNELSSGGYAIPNGLLFSVKNYPDIEQPAGLDPFQELREACHALEQQQQSRAALPPPGTATRGKTSRSDVWIAVPAIVILAVVLGVVFFTGRSSQRAPSAESAVVPGPGPITLNPNPDVDAILTQGNNARNSHNYKQAAKFFQQAANAGSPTAMHELGHLYEDDKKMTEARRWFRKAADLGDTQAMVDLGRLSKDGHEWFNKAAQKGDEAAMNQIGSAYSDGEWGYPLDLDKAMEWYHKSADLGDTQAMANIGHMYEEGLGVSKDIPQAISWYRRAITSAKDPKDEQGATDVLAVIEAARRSAPVTPPPCFSRGAAAAFRPAGLRLPQSQAFFPVFDWTRNAISASDGNTITRQLSPSTAPPKRQIAFR